MDKILKSFFFLCLFSINAESMAQNDMQDVLFLKNGKKIKGYIIDTDSINVKIICFGDKLIVVGDSDIIFQEKQPPGKVTVFNSKRFKSNGFQSQFEFMNGFSNYHQASTSIGFINGFKFENRFFSGIGISGILHHGSRGYIQRYNYLSFPVFIRFSSDLWAKRSTPYIFSDIGSQYENTFEKKLLKPFFFRLGLGNKLIIKKAIIYSSIAYSQNKARNYYSYWGPKGIIEGYSDWYRLNTVEINFGIQFN